MAPIDPKEWDKRYNDKDFSDIWSTNRGKGKVDKSRVWGTDEYFARVEKPRDEWDTGLDDFSAMTRKIKQDQERIRRDAQRIKLQAEKMASGIRDKFKTQQAQARIQAQKELMKDHNFTVKTKKKPKRRIKLSGKGIGIGGMIFWAIILINFCGDDNDDKTAKVVDTSSDTNYTEQVKESYDKLKPEAEKLIEKAKAELKEFRKSKSAPVVIPDNSNPYKQDDDRYGSVDDKW